MALNEYIKLRKLISPLFSSYLHARTSEVEPQGMFNDTSVLIKIPLY